MSVYRLAALVLALVSLSCGVTPSVHAATRLGLHVTDVERAIWQARMTDNVGTINGFTYQSIYQNRILAQADAFRGQSLPRDGYWEGWTGAGCAPGMVTTEGSGQTPYGRGGGSYLARSAFVFLLTGNTLYADPVRTALLTQVATPGTDFSNADKWCTTNLVDDVYVRAFEIVPWIYRLLVAYDYLLAGGYTGFSAGELTSINTWFLNAANFWHSMQALATSFGGYPGLFNTPPDLTCVGGNCTLAGALLYYNGPTVRNATSAWFMNQGTLAPLLSMAVGIMLDNPTHRTYATKWLTAFITVGIWDNGAMADWARWNDCNPGCPGGMWAHAGGALGAMTAAIDLLARTGDTSLYALSGPTQVLGGSGTVVSYETTLQLWAQMANKTVLLYALPGPAPNQLLTWDSDDVTPNPGNYHDFSSMAANLFYQNAAITTAMTRTALGTNGTQAPSSCNDSQYSGCFSGVWAFWPDVPFMAGNLDGVVDPYDLTASAPPTATITTDCGSGVGADCTVAATPLTTLAGTGADDVGVTSVTWACPTCTPTGGTATCVACGAAATAVTWSVASLEVALGANVITVTSHDGEAQTGTDSLTVTYTPPVTLSAPLRLRFVQ